MSTDNEYMDDAALELKIKQMQHELDMRKQRRAKYEQSEEDFCEMRRAAIAHSIMELLLDRKFRHMKALDVLVSLGDFERDPKTFGDNLRTPNDAELLRRLEGEDVHERVLTKQASYFNQAAINQRFGEDVGKRLQELANRMTNQLVLPRQIGDPLRYNLTGKLDEELP